METSRNSKNDTPADNSTPGTLKIERKVTFEEEVDYWCEEFPSLSREEIDSIFKEYEEYEKDESVDKSIDDSYNYDTYSK